MPHRIMNIDFQMIGLNIASVGSIVAWVTENATGFAGGFVLFTVGVLNLAKAYSTISESRKKKNK